MMTFDEIKENDYNLNIPRYVDTYEPEPLVDLDVVEEQIRAVKGKLEQVEVRIADYLSELGYGKEYSNLPEVK